MDSAVHDNVKKYYGKRLQKSEDLQSNASCSRGCRPMPDSAREALKLVHPDVCARYFGCGLVVPESLEGCKVLDLGSGSGRDCYILSKLVGQTGHVTGVDMTSEMILTSRKYLQYHQEKFGYEKANTDFVQGYLESLGEAGIQSDCCDVLISNCVICLCPDKRAVLQEAHRILKDGGEFYFSDMYASKAVPESLKQDPVVWGEGMGGALYWKDLISVVKELGFSTPYLVTASKILVHNSEILKKTGMFMSDSTAWDIAYASGTYRFFKLPKSRTNKKAVVTYRGTIPDYAEQLDFDALHVFKKGEAVSVDAEIAAVLQCSRFAPHFTVQSSDNTSASEGETQQYCHLNPFLLADRLGTSVQKSSKPGPCDKKEGAGAP
ncbi:arsenite methyltransferase [Huso huso]|uniref:Arsenite methyltransferase n=1 Tax=Huso huso TaxID=61971 RepID=A0ABR0ZN59_HUSHU